MRKFSIAAWSRKHPRAAARARKKGQRARRHGLSIVSQNIDPGVSRHLPLKAQLVAAFRRVWLAIGNHELRIRKLEGKD